MEPFQLHAIRYATNPHRRTVSNFLSNASLGDAPMPMDYYVWLAVSSRHTVLIDTGMSERACLARGHDYLCDPIEAMQRLGIAAAQVDHVVLTHLHWDHAGNLRRLPRARFHVHLDELAHACGPRMQYPTLRRPYDATQIRDAIELLHDGRLAFTGASTAIVPGITTQWVGGHSPGMQVVQVATERGRVVLASDAVHYFANLELANPFPILTDVVAYVAAWDSVRALADSDAHIVAGHDPLVMERYPASTATTDGLAVRLERAPRSSGTGK